MIRKLNRFTQTSVVKKKSTSTKRKDRILVVIRGAALRRIVCTTLERHGHIVLSKDCPKEALLLLTSQPSIKKILIARSFVCDPSKTLRTYAQRLKKQLNAVNITCLSDAEILKLIS